MSPFSWLLGSPRREEVSFGVELEVTPIPKTFSRGGEAKIPYYQRGYDLLKNAMDNGGIPTDSIKFRPEGSFVKYPKNYERWYLTHDTSAAGRNKREASEFPLDLRHTTVQCLINLS